MNFVPERDSTPRKVPFSQLGDRTQLDERVGAITVIFGSVVGVNEGYIEWCPDVFPPSEQERLAWIFLCNPALDAEILPQINGWFRELVLSYRAGEMQRWWADAVRPLDD